MAWFGLGKNRSALGRFLDTSGITQQEVSKKSGVPHSTISEWCDGSKRTRPIRRTALKVLRAIKELTGEAKEYEDFWA
ncbi:helix-turn-helix domain-containing protein [Tumebacillus permanentifrigoris]|uniref:Helix-turn-helix protein n=1 Tax=Tumebacillus permanentifrigoris TaxID=378543 RepID=A0A316D4T5_9BACL|nr:helix-turn-helix domain-containing protein [Tumebacillus permanentifrigoris]PWK07483.1 helix-turn-helix protein [Tumebacillus permanentifrigoris]